MSYFIGCPSFSFGLWLILLGTIASSSIGADDTVRVISIGDSHGAGVGYWEEEDEYDNRCYRTLMAPGPRLANEYYDSGGGVELIFKACYAGSIPSTMRQWRESVEESLDETISNGFADTTIVISAGGNDLRSIGGRSWDTLLVDCTLESDCHTNPENQWASPDNWQAELEDLYDAVVSDAPNARIRVMGYPRLFNTGWICWFAIGFDTAEARFMDALADGAIHLLEQAVKNVQTKYPEVDLEFVEVRNYLDRGACNFFYFWRHVRGIDIDSLIPLEWDYTFSYHPTALGYGRYYDALVDSLAEA